MDLSRKQKSLFFEKKNNFKSERLNLVGKGENV